MRTNGTQFLVIAVLLQLLLLIICISVNAQPKYDFRNATLVSGTDRQVGALYRFPNVRTGTDALVSITAITGGLTLNTLDGTSSGFAEAFQPVITLPAHSKGYVEFNITFVTAGTVIPVVQTEIPVTPIDVDGQSGVVYEFDDVYRYTSSYVDYSMVGGELKITYPSASLVEGMNSAGIDYPGVDTTATQVMFTVVNAGISSMKVRSGADNKSNSSQQRLRSFYFKKFRYPNSVLAQSALQSFKGNEENNAVELQFTINNDNSLKTIIIEKGNTSPAFQAIEQMDVKNGQTDFSYTDNSSMGDKLYYRLKMVGYDGHVAYSSILLFKSQSDLLQSLKVYPSIIQSSTTVSFKSDKSGTAIVRLIDYSGRPVTGQTVTVQDGINNIVINNLDKMLPGNYIMWVSSGNTSYSQKVIKE